jgi:large subunit ribosomal protein L23
MTDVHNILIKPILSEKATALTERHNHVSFRVLPGANKHQIRAAVESVYQVKVLQVRTSINPGKTKRKGNSIGRTPKTKKAIVTLKEGDTIDFYRAE